VEFPLPIKPNNLSILTDVVAIQTKYNGTHLSTRHYQLFQIRFKQYFSAGAKSVRINYPEFFTTYAIFREHTKDSDCVFDSSINGCLACGASFADPCPSCGAQAYHTPECKIFHG
jgi:hypothetical protein